MNALLELADRCERATGPDRELDLAISVVINYREMFADAGGIWQWSTFADELECRREDGKRCGYLDPAQFAPRWTASIDAAMTLVPEIKNRIVSTTEGLGHSVAYVRNGSITNPDVVEYSGSAKSTPLSIVAAALRSRTNGDDV